MVANDICPKAAVKVEHIPRSLGQALTTHELHLDVSKIQNDAKNRTQKIVQTVSLGKEKSNN